MEINSDVNVLGSLSDWNLIEYLYNSREFDNTNKSVSTSIKTEKSVKRFQKAIKTTFLTFKNEKIQYLFNNILINEGINNDLLFFLFWNASFNNNLLHHLNENVFFPAFYTGRIAIKTNEAVACLNELKNIEPDLKRWTENTIKTTSSKYLTLLKKFGFLEGSQTKTIVYPFLDEKMFIIFVYWLVEVSEKSNLLKSPWLFYGFMEKDTFIERLGKKQYTKFFDIYFTGDNLQVEPKLDYKEIYDAITGN